MNSFTKVFTGSGFTETLVFRGKTYVKRYAIQPYGYGGLDKAWENETDLPDEMIEALEDGDELVIMSALE